MFKFVQFATYFAKHFLHEFGVLCWSTTMCELQMQLSNSLGQGSHSHGKGLKSMEKNLVMESHGKVMEFLYC